jgi:UDP-N-acetylmuramate: L-alanyl-gamma-D-glutamyl-meso-diaminopimelate ligase
MRQKEYHASTGRHIHLIGICGTAMASLAGLLILKGHHVTGSDQSVYPPMSDILAELHIPVMQPYAEANLGRRPDMVVVGNAISRGNPELERVLDEFIPFTSMPALLHEHFLQGRVPLVVTGTHGKTTTTSMLAWIFEFAGKQPSFLIGGVAENFGSSFAWRESGYFILEGDEYDTAFFDKGPKFLHYFPHSVILTSVEFDHADIYSDLNAVKTAFKRLVNLVPRSGSVIAWDGDGNVDDCVAKAFCKVERYGFTERADWRVTDFSQDEKSSHWTVKHNNEIWHRFETTLAGEHNVLNATAAAVLAAQYEIPPEVSARALAGFKSVKRRLEVFGVAAGITLVSDFAHHPTAIAVTLRALRGRYPNTRLWAIFEPRSNTLRRKIFEQPLADSLSLADEVIVAPVFRPEAILEEDRLKVENVVAGIQSRSKSARAMPNPESIMSAIVEEAVCGDVVCILTNGGFGGIFEKLPIMLHTKHNTSVNEVNIA